MQNFDFTEGQLRIGTDGALLMVSGPDQTLQKMRQHLLHFLGEWFEDRTAGVPWYDIALGVVRPDLSLIKAQVVSTLTDIAEVDSVDSVLIDAPAGSSNLTITFTATLADGSQVTGEVSP